MKLIILLLTLTTLSLISCNSNPVDAEENLPPGRRDYVWELDTIPDRYRLFIRFWASSPEKIWVSGGVMWHYDGVSWKQQQGLHDIMSVYGTSEKNVWAGSRGKFWHYNGVSWKVFSEHTHPSGNTFYVDNLWGETENEFYGVGGVNASINKNVLMKFDGTKWGFVNVEELNNTFMDIRRINNNKNLFIITAYQQDQINGDSLKAYIYDGTSLTEIYKGIQGVSISRINEKTYIIMNNNIYKFNGKETLLFKDFGIGNQIWIIWGRHEKDLFLLNNSGLYHYNGTDLVKMYEAEENGFWLMGAYLFENSVVFLTYDTNTG